MKKLLSLAVVLFMTANAAFADHTVKADDPNISFTGRVQRMDNGAVSYDWVGTYVQTDFTGSSISVKVSEEGESYHQVFIDGKLVGKLHFTGKNARPAARQEPRQGRHRLRLQKVTEGERGRSTIFSFTAGGKGSFAAVQPKGRLIEVIGDSYTCGYGSE